MQIELRHLRYFLAIAERSNFSRAAQQLHISQPALSAQIKQLEKDLGTRLFDRIGRQVSITESGELLLKYAQKIMLELKEAKQAIDELQGLVKGNLTVGVVQTVNAYLMPTISCLFLRKYPGISLRMLELSATEIEKGVEDGQLALGISFVPAQSELIDTEKLFSEKLVLAVSKQHKLAHKKTISISSLGNESFIVFPQGFFTRQLNEQLFQAGAIKPHIAFEANTIASILVATANSNLVTIVPDLALRLKEGKNLRPINIKGSVAVRTIGFLWRLGAYRRKAAIAFSDITRSAIKSLGNQK